MRPRLLFPILFLFSFNGSVFSKRLESAKFRTLIILDHFKQENCSFLKKLYYFVDSCNEWHAGRSMTFNKIGSDLEYFLFGKDAQEKATKLEHYRKHYLKIINHIAPIVALIEDRKEALENADDANLQAEIKSTFMFLGEQLSSMSINKCSVLDEPYKQMDEFDIKIKALNGRFSRELIKNHNSLILDLNKEIILARVFTSSLIVVALVFASKNNSYLSTIYNEASGYLYSSLKSFKSLLGFDDIVETDDIKRYFSDSIIEDILLMRNHIKSYIDNGGEFDERVKERLDFWDRGQPSEETLDALIEIRTEITRQQNKLLCKDDSYSNDHGLFERIRNASNSMFDLVTTISLWRFLIQKYSFGNKYSHLIMSGLYADKVVAFFGINNIWKDTTFVFDTIKAILPIAITYIGYKNFYKVIKNRRYKSVNRDILHMEDLLLQNVGKSKMGIHDRGLLYFWLENLNRDINVFTISADDRTSVSILRERLKDSGLTTIQKLQAIATLWKDR